MRGPIRDGIWKQCPCPEPERGTPRFECVKRHGTYSFEIQIGVDPVTKKGVPARGTALPTRKAAQLAIAEVRMQAASAPVTKDRDLTVGEWLDLFYAARAAREGAEPKTLQGYRTTFPEWKRLIGHIKLRELTRADIDTALRELARERSPEERPKGRHGRWVAKRDVGSLQRYRANLSAALTDAQKKMPKILPVNHAQGSFDVLHVNKAEQAARALDGKVMWTPDETMEFFEFIVDHPFRLIYHCYTLTGTRRAEWLGAQWSAMNPTETSLAIKNTVVTDSGLGTCIVSSCPGHVGFHFKASPKTVAAARWMPLPDQLREALVDHRRAQRRAPKPAGWVDHDLIFPAADGGPLDPNTVTEVFQELTEAAGLPKLSGPHALRHMAVSMMLAQGTPVEVVSQITGDSIKTLKATYAHIIDEYARQSLQRYSNAILGRAPLPGFDDQAQASLATVTQLPARSGR